MRARSPQSHGEHAQLLDWTGRRAEVVDQTGTGKLHGVAGRSSMRDDLRSPTTGQATGVVRGAIWPACPRTTLGRMRGRCVIWLVSIYRRHVRETVLQRTRKGFSRRHGGKYSERDVRHSIEFRYVSDYYVTSRT